jgi:hypothetical protein
MSETILLGFLVLMGPLLLAALNNRARRKEKREDWARQDAVAEKAAEAATLLLAANERVAKDTRAQSVKLDALADGQAVIHTLVNSNVTKEMEARLEGSRRELIGLREIVELRQASGQQPSEQALAIILATEEGIHELENDLNDRRRQQKVVEAQQQQQQQQQEPEPERKGLYG